MYDLIFSFSKKEYPYLDEIHDPNICWGNIRLYLISDGASKIDLFELEWDVREFVKWLEENRKSILQDDLPNVNELKGSKGSIAKGIFDFYNNDEVFDESLLDEMYEYRRQHGVRFGLRGTDVKDIYLGKNGMGYEVSFYQNGEKYQYPVKLNSFFKDAGFEDIIGEK